MRLDLLDRHEANAFKNQFPELTKKIERCVKESREVFGYDKLSHAMIICKNKEPKVKSICKSYNLNFTLIKSILES